MIAVSEPGYGRPRNLEEAMTMRAAHPSWMLLAGGTDLLVDANHRRIPDGMIDIWRLPALTGICQSAAGGVVIGAGTTWMELEQHDTIRRRFAPLAEASREIGARQIQARGTIGGNVGTSSPVGDSLPVLLALDAEIELASIAAGMRRIAYREFCVGYRKTAMHPNELIVAIHIAAPAANTALHWRKIGTRKAQSISKVMGAAAIVDSDGRISSARIALGAVADRPIRLTALETAVVGLTYKQAQDATHAIIGSAISPISDIRSTAEYRRGVAANMIARFFSV
jgi:xanthine dehydrogenase small subunit